MKKQDFIQKWISRFGSFWDNWEGSFPYQPHIPVIATVNYQNTWKHRNLHPEELCQPDTIAFESLSDTYIQRHFICHSSSKLEYGTFQGSHFKLQNLKFL